MATAVALLGLLTSCFGDNSEVNSVHEAGNLDVSISDITSSEQESSADLQKKADFYIPNQTADGFVVSNEAFDGTIEGMIAKLVELEALPAGTEVISFGVNGDTVEIDLSKPFGDAMNGTAGEYLLIGSLVNTILDFYKTDTVNLKVGGKVLDTGHNIYDQPLSRYE